MYNAPNVGVNHNYQDKKCSAPATKENIVLTRNGYRLENNNQLGAIKNRVAQLPNRNETYGLVKQQSYLGSSLVKTHHLHIHPDGTAAIGFVNDFNDAFTVEIQMVRVEFSFQMQNHCEVYNSNLQGFLIPIGDIFKHYVKTHVTTSLATKKKQKGRKRDGDEEEAEDHNDEANVNKWALKSLTVDSSNNELRAVLGELNGWDRHELGLWRRLQDEGFLRTLGHDFTSFCRTFIVLPFKYSEDPLKVEKCLCKLSSYELVKKLLDYFLYGKDPSALNSYDRRDYRPTREYFEEPQSIVELLEKNNKQLSKMYEDYDYVMHVLVKELSQKRKRELEEKYQPVAFSNMLAVGCTYPLHAIRTIHLTSWSAEDFEQIRELISKATYVAMSSKSKYLIEKRGKFQHYATYEIGEESEISVQNKWGRSHSYDIVKRELAH